MDKIHVPPLKIQGIKTKLVTMIKSLIKGQKFKTWVEPFLGSGVVGFNVCPDHAIFADNNPHIINFYQAIKEKKISALIAREFLEEEGAKLAQQGETYYYRVRERFNQHQRPLDFLFLNRSDFNGMIRFNRKGQFNVPYGHKPQRFAPAYITKICHQIEYVQEAINHRDWTFYCQDFPQTIALAKRGDLIYCDPPYIGRHVDYFDAWDENLEQSLHDHLLRAKAKFVLSTWHHNQFRQNIYLDSIWQNCHLKTTKHFYFVGAKEQNRNAMTEALMYNFN
ncbi:MAG: Dam family site-specific DNA-(adenine-N6)-methyltransferase [Bacteriovoracaceae bacterium]|nr:Dam family site-specific DNA-(adenine-N6)-methyltransferase [Bacteriovoracaceae bacterium]